MIGKIYVRKQGSSLVVQGKLDLQNPMGTAVYERMLMPDSDPLALRELLIRFAYESDETFTGDKGETAIPDAHLFEVSVVYRGAQRTELTSVKVAKDGPALDKAAKAEIDEFLRRLDILDGTAHRAYVERRLKDAELGMQLEIVAGSATMTTTSPR